MSVEDYKPNNLLGVEITTRDVANAVLALVGPAFAKTTGAQIPIDGGRATGSFSRIGSPGAFQRLGASSSAP